jgi:hypothetical protein
VRNRSLRSADVGSRASARRVDQKLTDWRDALPLVRPGQNRETLHGAMAARRVAVTRRFELADPLFDEEEARGSNPPAPTSNLPGPRSAECGCLGGLIPCVRPVLFAHGVAEGYRGWTTPRHQGSPRALRSSMTDGPRKSSAPHRTSGTAGFSGSDGLASPGQHGFLGIGEVLGVESGEPLPSGG